MVERWPIVLLIILCQATKELCCGFAFRSELDCGFGGTRLFLLDVALLAPGFCVVSGECIVLTVELPLSHVCIIGRYCRK